MFKSARNPVQAIEIDRSFITDIKLKNKQTTIRAGIRNFNPEKSIIYNIEEQFVFPIQITEVKVFLFNDIPEEYIIADGYKNLDEFFIIMTKFYPTITKSDFFTVISWTSI